MRRVCANRVSRGFRAALAIVIGLASLGCSPACWAGEWSVGLAKIDVTPKEPVRLSGYGSREVPHQGVETPLHVRCFAFRWEGDQAATDKDTHLLYAIDTIGLPARLTHAWSQKLQARYQIPRQQIVWSATHTHCAPHLAEGLSNLFSVPMTDTQTEASRRYAAQLEAAIFAAAEQAIASLRPGKLSFGQGSVPFAANRRVLDQGKWKQIGVQNLAPVDHSVPVLRIDDAEGKLLGVVFNYACHCTTMSTNFVNADWAGYATTILEAQFPGAVALCTIGCGADANPEPRGSQELALLHGRALAAEVARVTTLELQSIEHSVVSRFDVVAASFDLPTIEEVRARRESGSPQERRLAEKMVQQYEEEGRFPATYPIPLQAWQFGQELSMLFLGGEVVVDYALRLKRELANDSLWVSAYCNDVMGYVCSERMRSEGGYEYDTSAIYYGLAGPWAAGTEDLIVEKIHKLLQSQGRPQALAPEASLGLMRVSPGFSVELVACEPQVCDPINIAFGPDGRLWVVEMGDYPAGDPQGAGGLGKIKVLSDVDGDRFYERAEVFLEGLEFPTAVYPWRDGVIVAAAPRIFFARDTDRDGRADEQETLFSGFVLANPQHRINGFAYGLDHSLFCASGDTQGMIRSERTGESISGAGYDFQIFPETGSLQRVSGRSQYIRSRNAWGEWFGSDNSQPMYHYPVDVQYAQRNPAVVFPGGESQLFDPPVAPPVYPQTSGAERLNDLFAANRFTSACSAIVVDGDFGFADIEGILVCEPVHNLVHRSMLVPAGTTYRAVRGPEEENSEWLASSDPWFRPVRVASGPDGAVYVVDMYRETIEHPEWIPQAWKEMLDLRAGSDRGRIYRVFPTHRGAESLAVLTDRPAADLIPLLESDRGTFRDLAHQQLIERAGQEREAVEGAARRLLQETTKPLARVHALGLLQAIAALTPADVRRGLAQEDLPTIATALRQSESFLARGPELLEDVLRHLHQADPRVLLRVALALGATDDPRAGNGLAEIIATAPLDPWLVRGVISSAPPHAKRVLQSAMERAMRGSGGEDPLALDLLAGAMQTYQSSGGVADELIRTTLFAPDVRPETQLRLAVVYAKGTRGLEERGKLREVIAPVHRRALDVLGDQECSVAERCLAANLLGRGLTAEEEEEKTRLLGMIVPSTSVEVQEEALRALARLGGAESAQRLLDRWPSLSQRVRQTLVDEMLGVRQWHETLLQALEGGSVRPADLTLAARQQLRFSGSRSQQVRVDRLLGTAGDVDARLLVDQYLQAMGAAGDVARGAAIYTQHCAVCHQADSQGRTIGPSLSNLSDRSPRYLLHAILDPNGILDAKYQTVAIETVDGRILSGMIEAEDAQGLSIAAADGTRVTIPRREIDQLRSTGVSLMPSGFQQQITPAMMSDLVQFIAAGRFDLVTAPAQEHAP